MNTITLAGRLGADAETRVTPDGTKVTTLRLATNQRIKGQDETVWWRITLWGDRWERMVPHFTKGSALIVTGEMKKPEIWTNRDGQPQVSLEVRGEIVRFSPFGGQRQEQQGQAAQQHSSAPAAGGFGDSFGGAPTAAPEQQSFSPTGGQPSMGQAAPLPSGDLDDGMPF